MEKIRKIAALSLVLCAMSSILSGCRNESELSKRLDTVKLASESVRNYESGEIMVYETLKTGVNIEGKLESGVTETYIKFINQGELEYDFTEFRKFDDNDDVLSYEATQENGTLIVKREGIAVDASEAPDIFSYTDITYEVADIEKVDVFTTTDNITVYAFTMTDAYADKFDSDVDGMLTECEKVLYNYYIDSEGRITSILSEFTSSVSYEQTKQTIVRFVQTSVN